MVHRVPALHTPVNALQSQMRAPESPLSDWLEDNSRWKGLSRRTESTMYKRAPQSDLTEWLDVNGRWKGLSRRTESTIYMRAPLSELTEWLEVNDRWKGLPRRIEDMIKKVNSSIPPPIPLPPITNASVVQPELPVQPDHFSQMPYPPQMLPPQIIDNVKFSKLLQQWEGNVLKAVSGSVLSERYDTHTKNGASPSPWKQSLRSKAMVLRRMIDVMAQARETLTSPDTEKATRDNTLRLARRPSMERDRNGALNLNIEIVGLINEDSMTAAGRGVLAVGVFSRGKLEDDSKGSLRQTIEELHGKRYGTRGLLRRKRKSIKAFAIEGLAGNTPGRDTQSAENLLANIEEYAQKERRAVLVVYPSYIGNDGTDLTEYYVRLGFVLVEMETGAPVLVYAGPSSRPTHAKVEDWHGNIMVGFDLLTGS